MATPPPPHRWSVVVARIASTDIRIHATFLILVVLFAVAAPEPGAGGVAWRLVWLGALFGSVVLHEPGTIAHALVADDGAPVGLLLLSDVEGLLTPAAPHPTREERA